MFSSFQVRNEKLMNELSYLAADYEEQRHQSAIEISNLISKKQTINGVVNGDHSSQGFRNNNSKDDDTIEEDDELKKNLGLDADFVAEEVIEEDGLQKPRTLQSELLELKQQLLSLMTDKQQMEMRLLALEVQQPPLQMSNFDNQQQQQQQQPLESLPQLPTVTQEQSTPLQTQLSPEFPLTVEELPQQKTSQQPPEQQYIPLPLPVIAQLSVVTEDPGSNKVEVQVDKFNDKTTVTTLEELNSSVLDSSSSQPIEVLAIIKSEPTVGGDPESIRYNNYDDDEFEDVTATVEASSNPVIVAQDATADDNDNNNNVDDDVDDDFTVEPPGDEDEGLDDLLAFTEAAMANDSIKASNGRLLKKDDLDNLPLQLAAPTFIALEQKQQIPEPASQSQPLLTEPLQQQPSQNIVLTAAA